MTIIDLIKQQNSRKFYFVNDNSKSASAQARMRHHTQVYKLTVEERASMRSDVRTTLCLCSDSRECGAPPSWSLVTDKISAFSAALQVIIEHILLKIIFLYIST